MKNLFGILCAAGGMMLVMSACTDEVETSFQNSFEEEGMKEVYLNLGGDSFDVYEGPLTRATPKKKLYAVNVSYSQKGDSIAYGKYVYKPYAYGLFDNKNDMKIQLSDKFVYKFECTAVAEDRNELMYYGLANGSDIFYSYPFAKVDNYVAAAEKYYNNDPTTLALLDKTITMNKFTYSTTVYLEVNSGKSNVKFIDVRSKDTKAEAIKYTYTNYNAGINSYQLDSLRYNQTSNPGFDRLYGELRDFVADSIYANIDLTRTAFGLEMRVTPPTNGKLHISSNLFTADVTPTMANPTVFKSLYSFDKVYDCWVAVADTTANKKAKAKEDSTKAVQTNIVFNFTIERENGSQQVMTKGITFNRNRLTTVVFDAEKIFEPIITITENETVTRDTTIVVK